MNIIICENNKRLESDLMSQFVKKKTWAILAHDMNLFIYCLFSVIKLDLVNCVTQEAGDELSRGNSEAPTAHHTDSSM